MQNRVAAGDTIFLTGRTRAVRVAADINRKAAATLGKREPAGPPPVLGLNVDFAEPAAFAAAMTDARAACGPFDYAVVWLRSWATQTGLPAIAGALGGSVATPATLVHVLGSATGDTAALLEAARQCLGAFTNVRYRAAVLGCVDEPGGGWRWLSDAEISAGVLGALQSDAARVDIGRVQGPDR